MTKYGIDVSYHQGEIDWNKVKNSGKVDFVIMRAGIGSKKDTQFENYYSACKKLGIPVGAYWYSYATTENGAVQEANAFLQAVKGKTFEYPLFFDIEEKSQFNTGKNNCSNVAKAFCETLEKDGYFAGIYASKSHLETYLSAEVRQRFAIWVAHYGVSKTSYNGSFGMWQKSETGKINGISGNVDLDECYQDYPTIIKNIGLNGFPKPEKAVESVLVDAQAVNPETKEIFIESMIVDGVKYSGTVAKCDEN